MMHMTLYWGTEVTLLFQWWRTHSWTSYSLTLLLCFFFAIVFQFMEDRRLSLLAVAAAPPSAGLISRRRKNRWSDPARLGTAVLFGVNSAMGYLLMLGVMSFNVGVLIAVVLGLGVGYLLFRAKEYEAVFIEDACACS